MPIGEGEYFDPLKKMNEANAIYKGKNRMNQIQFAAKLCIFHNLSVQFGMVGGFTENWNRTEILIFNSHQIVAASIMLE